MAALQGDGKISPSLLNEEVGSISQSIKGVKPVFSILVLAFLCFHPLCYSWLLLDPPDRMGEKKWTRPYLTNSVKLQPACPDYGACLKASSFSFEAHFIRVIWGHFHHKDTPLHSLDHG